MVGIPHCLHDVLPQHLVLRSDGGLGRLQYLHHYDYTAYWRVSPPWQFFLANMYFVLFGANSQAQALFLIESLKLGQCGKLSPRCNFTVQTFGTVFGACMNCILMVSITTSQREILLSIEGSIIRSGQVIQSFNSNVSYTVSQETTANSMSQAIAVSALSKYMFSIRSTYQYIMLSLPIGFIVPAPFYFLYRRSPKLGFSQVLTPVICYYLGCKQLFLPAGSFLKPRKVVLTYPPDLSVSINSSVMMYFMVGFVV